MKPYNKKMTYWNPSIPKSITPNSQKLYVCRFA